MYKKEKSPIWEREVTYCFSKKNLEFIKMKRIIKSFLMIIQDEELTCNQVNEVLKCLKEEIKNIPIINS